MKYTISTHCGKEFSQRHNRRDRSLTDREEHIDPNGKHEIWEDYDLRELYDFEFGLAVERYNKKQRENGRPGRQVEDYYMQVKNSKQQNLAYEIIVAVGNKQEHPDEEISHEILKKYANSWERRNPNLIVAGMYYHADEQGVPHLHVTFVPVANYSRGIARRTGWARALQEQGYTSRQPQSEWVANENKCLEEICKEKGLEIYHPQKGLDLIHQTAAEYRTNMERAEQEISKAQDTTEITRELEECRGILESTEKGFTNKIKITEEDKNKILELLKNLEPILEIQKALDELCQGSKKKLTKISELAKEYQSNFFHERQKLEERSQQLDQREMKLDQREIDVTKREDHMNSLDGLIERAKAEEWEKHRGREIERGFSR